MKKGYLVMVCLLAFFLVNSVVFASTGDKKQSLSQTVENTTDKQSEVKEDKADVFQISFGMRGEDVRTVQRFLVNGGFYFGEIDGIFGNMTLKAVKNFQQSNGLAVDGIVTREALLYLERCKAEPDRYSRVIHMSATAYSAYDPGNGSYTARGNLLRKGLVAVDPYVIPLGTRLYIKGYGFAVADDTGGSIKGNRIDLAFDTHAEAIQFGSQGVTVYILD